MRIQISFYTSGDYTFDNIENYIRVNPCNGKKEFTVQDIGNTLGEELKQVLIDDYFSGADNAVVYLGYSLELEYFEFDLIPN